MNKTITLILITLLSGCMSKPTMHEAAIACATGTMKSVEHIENERIIRADCK